jgi:hypothetical protein
MKRKRFTEEQIIEILNEAEQAGNIREVCRLNNFGERERRVPVRAFAGATAR